MGERQVKPEVQGFLNACEANPSLHENLQKASAQEIEQAAAKLGYQINITDLVGLLDDEMEGAELSENELEAVAGGASSWLIGSCSGCSSGASCGLICRTIAQSK